MAHPPGGLHHNNRIPPDYTRVEVHTVKPEFVQWSIDYPTPDEQQLLEEVMNQFILWHKQDIILIASLPPVQRLEGVLEDGEILSPSCDHHLPEMPQSSPPCSEHMPEMPQSSPRHREHGPDEMPHSSLQAKPIHKQQVPAEEVHAQEGARKETEIQKKHPIHIRTAYVPMIDVTTMAKWYAYDQFKPEN